MENKQVDQNRDSNEISTDRTCYGCREPLPSGTTFCVACGKQNLSPDAGGMAIGKTNMATQESKDRWKQIKRWFRHGSLRRWD